MTRPAFLRGQSGTRSTVQPDPGLLLKLAGSLGSGLLSAVSLTAIASQRIGRLDAEVAVTLLLFIQWQVMALTVAKLGIDQVVFSVVSQDRSLRFGIGEFLWKRAMPIALISGAAIAAAFSPILGIVAAGSVIVDTYSVVVTADLNARGRFGSTALANLLNYPVFFVLLLGASTLTQNAELLAVLFLISSVARAGWLATRYRRERFTTTVQVQGMPVVAAQQALNYVLFRGDQLLLALIPAAGAGLAVSLTRDEYVYLAKYPELAAGGLVILGLYLFPRVELRPQFHSVRSSVHVPVWLWIVLGNLTLMLTIAYMVYTSDAVAQVLTPSGRSWGILMPFLLQALMALPVNGVTYIFLGQGHGTDLVKFQLVAIGCAAAMAAAAFKWGSLIMLAWVVPIQLAVFLLLGVFASVRRASKRPLYA